MMSQGEGGEKGQGVVSSPGPFPLLEELKVSPCGPHHVREPAPVTFDPALSWASPG